MIVYGSGTSDGNRHNHDNLPILLAGSGGGSIATGRICDMTWKRPVCNLFMSMLDRMVWMLRSSVIVLGGFKALACRRLHS